MRTINEIILHCSATREGQDYSASDINRWHKARGWACIGYHYVIHLDGTVETGRPVEAQGAHCLGHNANSIGICYIGGVDAKYNSKDTRTVQQKESLIGLVKKLMKDYNLTTDQIHCHNEYAAKDCPSFLIHTFKNELKNHE